MIRHSKWSSATWGIETQPLEPMPPFESVAPLHLQHGAAHKVAVFVDIENFAGYCADLGASVDLAPVLRHIINTFGRICIKRSFGDVASLPRSHFNTYEIRRMLQFHQVEHVDMPHRPSSYSKNSADIRLVVDAVALIHQRPDITHLVVVSNDRDFIPLYNHAREFGKTVVGCGPARGRVSEDTVSACDTFVFHEDFPEVKPVVVASAPLGSDAAAPQVPSLVAFSEPMQATDVSGVAEDLGASISPAEQVHLGRLVATLHAMHDEGLVAYGSQVNVRMKQLFADFDVKKEFGTFKAYCVAQEKSGRIRVLNREQPGYTLELIGAPSQPANRPAVEPVAAPAANLNPASGTSTAHAPGAMGAAKSFSGELLHHYREWAWRKFKVAVPTLAVRQQLYERVVAVLARRSEDRMATGLKELASLVALDLFQLENAQALAYRICYGLFRGKAFHVRLTENAFDPDIVGLAVNPDALEECFALNTLKSFEQDKQHGLPFDPVVFAQLLNDVPQVDANTEPSAPSPDPVQDVVTEASAPPESAAQLPALEAAALAPEPLPQEAAESEPDGAFEAEPRPGFGHAAEANSGAESESEGQPKRQAKPRADPKIDPTADTKAASSAEPIAPSDDESSLEFANEPGRAETPAAKAKKPRASSGKGAS